VKKSVIIFLLLVCNGVLALMLVMGMVKNREQRAQPHEIIIDELGFDEVQAEAYRALLDEHRTRVGPVLEQLRLEKEKYFRAAAAGDLNLTFADINHTQNHLDSLLGAHLASVYKLCTAEQRNRFEQTVQKVIAEVPR
jgi:hypothetical protein